MSSDEYDESCLSLYTTLDDRGIGHETRMTQIGGSVLMCFGALSIDDGNKAAAHRLCSARATYSICKVPVVQTADFSRIGEN